MIIGVLIDRASQFKDFIIRNDLVAYNEGIAHNENKDTYIAIQSDIAMKGLVFDEFLDLRELSINAIVTRMKNPPDTTINDYKVKLEE